MQPAEVFEGFCKQLEQTLALPVKDDDSLQALLTSDIDITSEQRDALQNGQDGFPLAYFLNEIIKPNVDKNLPLLIKAMKEYDDDQNGPVSQLAYEISQKLEDNNESKCWWQNYKCIKILKVKRIL